MFSLLTFLFLEAPMANVLNQFFKAKTQEEKNQDRQEQFYRSQSAKAYLRDKKRKRGKKTESLITPSDDIEERSTNSK